MPRPQRKKSTDPEKWVDVKHFRPRDFACRCGRSCSNGLVPISMDVVKGLDSLREKIGLPMKVYKGVSCPQASKAGGPSGHVPSEKTGLAYAVDVAIPSAEIRYQMIQGAMELGFNAIGIGKNWLHLEMNPSQTRRTLWIRPPTRKKR